ncbi:MAG: hypothetical protein HY746_09380 [Elusimicrobia bacterium]|nr:hypothetical protein [Elusimicrobiota bacterium]
MDREEKKSIFSSISDADKARENFSKFSQDSASNADIISIKKNLENMERTLAKLDDIDKQFLLIGDKLSENEKKLGQYKAIFENGSKIAGNPGNETAAKINRLEEKLSFFCDKISKTISNFIANDRVQEIIDFEKNIIRDIAYLKEEISSTNRKIADGGKDSGAEILNRLLESNNILESRESSLEKALKAYMENTVSELGKIKENMSQLLNNSKTDASKEALEKISSSISSELSEQISQFHENNKKDILKGHEDLKDEIFLFLKEFFFGAETITDFKNLFFSTLSIYKLNNELITAMDKMVSDIDIFIDIAEQKLPLSANDLLLRKNHINFKKAFIIYKQKVEDFGGLKEKISKYIKTP